MNIFRRREPGHSVAFFVLLPALLAAGCHSGVSGHAPGVAGTQSLDPGTFTYPLAYIKRPPLAAGVDIDARDLITSTAGGDVYVRDQASAGSAETNITKALTGGRGDVRDLDVSADGKKLVFSLRLPLDANKANTDVTQPTWKIYEYDATAKTVTQLTNDTTTAGHDLGAHYLPDGRIVFASTRQSATQTLLIDEGRPQYPAQTDDRKQAIFLLHVMNADGGDIHQISFNTNHDFAPSVLNDGRIVFSRYEGTHGDQISLYRTNPDGTGLELYYGANSHATGASTDGTNTNVIQFLNARQRADGRLVAIVRPFTGTQLGGDILQIDAANYVECDQPSTPGGGATCATARPAQNSATTLGVTTDVNKPSLGGRFASVYPLYDGTQRMLVSWTPCLVQTTHGTATTTSLCTSGNTSGANVVQAPPEYAIWVYDSSAGTLSPLLAAQTGLTLVEPVVLQARSPVPSFVPDTVPTGDAAILAGNSNGGLGLLIIRSVYDFDGLDTVSAQTNGALADIAALADPKQATADQRPARFIRIEKAVEIPDRTGRKINASAFGPANMGMREILAYAPIEPDGSVQIQLPANVPFTLDILDKNGRRTGAQHPNWLQLRPGETKTCNGCHTAGATATPSHGRSGLTASANPGAPAAGPWPNAVASLPALAAGDSMAATRANATCASVSATGCSEIPSVDVVYADVWTDPAAAGRAADTAFGYLYADLTTPQPKNAHCAPWDPLCRSTIHYPLHIQPLWNFARQTVAADGVTVLTDHTCVTCHNSVSTANAVQVPPDSLDLTGAASTVDTAVSVSYEQLLFARDQQTVSMGALQDFLVPAAGPPDPVTGMATTIMVPVSLAPPMTAGNASASVVNFLRYFDGTYHDAALDHTGFLTPAELRLITEWLDIGAQYYNDPFVAPVAN